MAPATLGVTSGLLPLASARPPFFICKVPKVLKQGFLRGVLLPVGQFGLVRHSAPFEKDETFPCIEFFGFRKVPSDFKISKWLWLEKAGHRPSPGRSLHGSHVGSEPASRTAQHALVEEVVVSGYLIKVSGCLLGNTASDVIRNAT